MYTERSSFIHSQEKKSWNIAMVAVGVVCGCIGAASIAHFAAAPAANQLYAPIAVRAATTSQVAPGPRFAPATRAAAQAQFVQAQQETLQAEEVVAPNFEAPAQTTPWTPLLGLLAIPIGVVALMLRKSVPADKDVEAGIPAAAAAAGLFAAAAEPAMAAQEVAQVADNRLTAVAALLVPAVGWVGFNILGAANRQLEEMSAKAEGRAPRSSAPAPKPKRGRK